MTTPQGFAMIPRWLVERSDVSPNARTLFSILSGRVREGGIRCTRQDIADALGLSVSTTKRALKELRDLGVLDWTDSVGDVDGVTYTLLVDRRGLDDTPGHQRPTPQVTSDPPPESPVTLLPYRGSKTSLLRRESAPATRGTRIPADFTVTPPMRAWAADKAPRVDLDAETEKFVDYWTSESGARARKVDWLGTWRNWIRRAADDRRGPRVVEPTQRYEVVEQTSCPLCPEPRSHWHNRAGDAILR